MASKSCLIFHTNEGIRFVLYYARFKTPTTEISIVYLHSKFLLVLGGNYHLNSVQPV